MMAWEDSKPFGFLGLKSAAICQVFPWHSWVMMCGCSPMCCSFSTCDLISSVIGLLLLLNVCSIVPGKDDEFKMVCLWWAGGVSRLHRVLIAFSSVGAFVTHYFVMSSCKCSMAVSRQSVADTAGSGIWCWNEIVSMIIFASLFCMTTY